MRSVVDVAAYILDKYGAMTTMKLEKLAYYSQAYSLSHGSGAPLFSEDFQAWVNGPVAPELYREHRGMFLIHKEDLSRAVEGHAPLSAPERRIVDAVCGELSGLTGNQLSERTHSEGPWCDAREGCGTSDRCDAVISKRAIREYYSEHPVVGAV